MLNVVHFQLTSVHIELHGEIIIGFSVFTSSQANYSAENKVSGLGKYCNVIVVAHWQKKSCITELKNSYLRCGGYELKQPQLVAIVVSTANLEG